MMMTHSVYYGAAFPLQLLLLLLLRVSLQLSYFVNVQQPLHSFKAAEANCSEQ
jgi:hypothetical protein